MDAIPSILKREALNVADRRDDIVNAIELLLRGS
jgi:hypothetical protein